MLGRIDNIEVLNAVVMGYMDKHSYIVLASIAVAFNKI
jgi:hypothetical protein